MDHRFIEPDEILQIEPAVTKNVIGGLVDEGKNLRAFPPEILMHSRKMHNRTGLES